MTWRPILKCRKAFERASHCGLASCDLRLPELTVQSFLGDPEAPNSHSRLHRFDLQHVAFLSRVSWAISLPFCIFWGSKALADCSTGLTRSLDLLKSWASLFPIESIAESDSRVNCCLQEVATTNSELWSQQTNIASYLGCIAQKSWHSCEGHTMSQSQRLDWCTLPL